MPIIYGPTSIEVVADGYSKGKVYLKTQPITEINPMGDDFATFSDGARVSWGNGIMLCTCVTAKAQPRDKNCCKHITNVIRRKRDYIVRDQRIYLPVVLPDKEDDLKQVSWVEMGVHSDSQVLFVYLQNQETAWIGSVGQYVTLSRLDARSMILPHLLGLANKVTCRECHDAPLIIQMLLKDRTNLNYQLDAVREILHWLTNPNQCRKHDDSDLVPF